MKLLLVLLAVGVLFWLLRGSLARRMPPRASKHDAPDAPQPMLTCAHCGMHLPRDEALPGRGGVFCDAAHRAAFEQAHPE
jgi:uncharacterized protein